jgi:Domain of unknown function (DUF932)
MQITTGSSFSYAKFGKNSVVLEARNGAPLDLATIARTCPSVFAEDKHHSRSDKYTFISTKQVLEALATEGFFPHSIMQGGTRIEDKLGYTKHLIRFRQQGFVGRGGTQYEVCLLGSHDGTTSYQMFGGFYRALCKNGMIWFDQGATKIAIPHKGDIIQQVVDAAFTVIGQSQIAYDDIDRLRGVQLDRDEQMAFAASAAIARFEGEAPVTPAQLLIPRRQGDVGNDLWTCFNRVQENVIRGGITFTAEQKLSSGETRLVQRHTRPVRSVDGDVRLNRALWTLADEMAKIKAAA